MRRLKEEIILIPLPEMDVQNKNAESYILNFKKYKSLVDEAEKVYEKSINDFNRINYLPL